MSSISAISNTILKRTIPFCSQNYLPIFITQRISVKKQVTRRNLPTPLMASRDPPEYPTRIPPAVPPASPPSYDPSIPIEVPPFTTAPEVDPGGAPSEVKENPPPHGPEPTPEIAFPKPPVSPPPKPNVPPDRQPGPEINPPRTPLPDIPPVRPPGPEILPPPNLSPDIKPPPGSPFGDFGFTI